MNNIVQDSPPRCYAHWHMHIDSLTRWTAHRPLGRSILRVPGLRGSSLIRLLLRLYWVLGDGISTVAQHHVNSLHIQISCTYPLSPYAGTCLFAVAATAKSSWVIWGFPMWCYSCLIGRGKAESSREQKDNDREVLVSFCLLSERKDVLDLMN